MLRQRNIQHKRKNSQIDLFYPSSNNLELPQSQPKNKQSKHTNDRQPTKTNNDKQQIKTNNDTKLKLSLDQNKPHSNAKNILKLVQNSQKRAHQKQTLIQDIDQQNKWGNENIDCSNGACIRDQCNNCESDQNIDTYFQFGRRSRCSSIKKQNYDTNYGYLNMEEITEVPDTMSNQRRYDSTNFYQFPSSHQSSLINFSNRLINQKEGEQDLDTSESQKNKQSHQLKLIEEPKNLKKRKQKLPRNVLIQGDEVQENFDLSELSKLNKKSKLFFVNRKEDKKSKSRQNLGRVEKDKSRSSLFLTKKSKTLSQAFLGGKKKSVSLKNEAKSQLKIGQKKPKSFQKPKSFDKQKETYHPTKSSQQLFQKPLRGQKLGLTQTCSQNPKSVQLGQKIMLIQQSQSKLQNQYKILWECMGELWENSRITRYISQKNKSDIIKLKEGEQAQDDKMIKLKSEILSSIASARY